MIFDFGKSNSNLGIKAELLWENASPTSNFAAQTIDLDLVRYSGVIIEFKGHNNVTTIGRFYAQKSDYLDLSTTHYSGIGYNNSTTHSVGTRNILNVDDTGVEFDDTYVSSSVANDWCIPLRIYGVKSDIV